MAHKFYSSVFIIFLSFDALSNETITAPLIAPEALILPNGWCERLEEGHWIKTADPITQAECEKWDKRDGTGTPYTWQQDKPSDSLDGSCTINGTRQYETSQRGCENHDKNRFGGDYRWTSDAAPMIYVSRKHRGYSHRIERDVPQFEGEYDRFRHQISSYTIPQGWRVRFYSRPGYLGDYYTRSSEDDFDRDDFPFGKNVESIRVWKASTLELTTSSHQIYFGDKDPSINCGANARLLTKQDVDNIGQSTLCNDVRSPYAIWKINGIDNTNWSFMGSGYNCDMKSGVNPWAESLCVMTEAPPANTAYIFSSNGYQGSAPWAGNAEIKGAGSDVPESNVGSFKLGPNTTLVAYSAQNYLGTEKTYTTSTSNPTFTILSYKVK